MLATLVCFTVPRAIYHEKEKMRIILVKLNNPANTTWEYTLNSVKKFEFFYHRNLNLNILKFLQRISATVS